MRWAVVVLIASVAAVSDVRTGRIPNALTFPVFFAGLAASTLWAGAGGPFASLGSAMVLAFPALVLFLFANGGAGDVKLLGALGAWLGFHDAVFALVCVSAAGVVCGLTWTMIRRRSALLFSNLSRIIGIFALAFTSRRLRDAAELMPEAQIMQPMPYGVAIALGVWAAAAGRWLW